MNIMQFLQDNAGQNSSMRGIMLAVMLAVIGTWVLSNCVMLYNVVIHGAPLAIVDFNSNMVWVVTAVLGGKVAQSFSENKSVK